jgi:hypothetical protein
MIPLSGWVLLAAAVITSPALWSGLVVGTMPLDVVLTRYLVVTAGCWLAFSLAADLVWPRSAPQPAGDDEPGRGLPEPEEPGDVH